ncbi:MAG: hypothetical protein HC866_00910 [Leptolyngbyaceae cyanobacterium RU_5_1]|nr:hypothetical protein [Leptolyngbyaceae cyanobacterium RU_5_1]
MSPRHCRCFFELHSTGLKDSAACKSRVLPEYSRTGTWLNASISPIDIHSVIWVIRDISEQHAALLERKQTEEQIKTSLKEKEVLLKEIHHRVKNNLQIVDSLLQLQSRRTDDRHARAILIDSRNRIASIALVHEKLYRSEDLANIAFAQYVPDLTAHLFDSYNISSSAVTLNTEISDISLEIETAIPCGLIINELVSNSLKYAFPDNQEGEISVRFYTNSNDTLTLIVRDNGIGIPKEFNIEDAKSLGLTLVQSLVEQLEGILELNCSQGTEFKISFPEGRTRL